MNTVTYKVGSRSIVATQNDEKSQWHARLYAGDVATLINKRFSANGIRRLEKWANEILTEQSPSQSALPLESSFAMDTRKNKRPD